MGVKEDDEFIEKLEAEQDAKGIIDPIISAKEISKTYDVAVSSNGRVSDYIAEIAVNDQNLSKEKADTILLKMIAKYPEAAETAAMKLDFYATSDNKSLPFEKGLYLEAAQSVRDWIISVESASKIIHSSESSLASTPSPAPEPIGAEINSGDPQLAKMKSGRPKE